MHQELTQIARTLREMPFPKKVALEICGDCNLSCAMCYHPTMQRAKGTMPFELWQICADQIAVADPTTECWFSFCGEPLKEPELLMRMLSYGKSIGLSALNVNTNGMLLTPELADPLLDTGADLVVFGIDAYESETYAKIRCGGERDVLYANVEHFLERRRARESGPEVQVQFIEMPENVHELEDFSRHWSTRGASLKVRRMLSWGGRFQTPSAVPERERIPCPWAMTMMHVFWDGRAPRCPGDMEGEDQVGSAWHVPLTTLWARLGTYRDLHMERRFDELPDRCHDCSDWMVGAAQRVRPDGGSVG